MKRIRKRESKESDAARLNDLARQYGLAFKKAGMIYIFEDYIACGLDQALGYAEGFDRAVAACQEQAARTRVLADQLEAMGFNVGHRGGKEWHNAGVRQSAIDTFRKRAGQVGDAATELGIRNAALKAELAAKTRSKK